MGEDPVIMEVCHERGTVWSDSVSITRDEIAKCRIIFHNADPGEVQSLSMVCVLTKNLEIIDNPRLTNSQNPETTTIDG